MKRNGSVEKGSHYMLCQKKINQQYMYIGEISMFLCSAHPHNVRVAESTHGQEWIQDP